MWEKMYYFVVMGVTLDLLGQFDVITWCNDLRKRGDAFQVDNVDILAKIPRVSQTLKSQDFRDLTADELFTSDRNQLNSPKNRYLEFVAPRKLRIFQSSVPPLLSGQLLIAMNSSLISPGNYISLNWNGLWSLRQVMIGTELKVFNGLFDRDQPTDTTISGMQEGMRYPLRYGYCAVGKVVNMGPDVDASWLGKQVFSFSPHGTIAVTDTTTVKVIPEDLSAEDAAFAPSMETALSFVQDLQPLLVLTMLYIQISNIEQAHGRVSGLELLGQV